MGPDQVRWVGSHLLRRPVPHSAPAPIELSSAYIANIRQATITSTSSTELRGLPSRTPLDWILVRFPTGKQLLGLVELILCD